MKQPQNAEMPEGAGSRSEVLGFLVRTEAGAREPGEAMSVSMSIGMHQRSPAISRRARIHSKKKVVPHEGRKGGTLPVSFRPR